MQGYPNVGGPLSAGGAPVPGVPVVPGPANPTGVTPNLTQYPTAPVSGYPSHYMAPSLGYAPTYQGAPAPGYTRVPGPAPLGPTVGQTGTPGPGGVAGVTMAPLAGVQPPATTGGPHPLPALPQVPLPQGFPNPLAIQSLTPMQPESQPLQPGTTTTTGPMGYMPGIGQFGTQAGAGQPAVPGPSQGPLPGAMPSMPQMPAMMPMPPAPPQAGAAPQQFPQQPIQHAPTQAPPIPPQQQAGQPAQAGPFWLQLAWQMVQAPAVKEALGHDWQALVEGADRSRTLHVAASCLLGQELQNAFKALTSGQLDQQSFTEAFARSLKGALFAAAPGR